MSLLLLSRTAEKPFLFEKLNLRLYSFQELAYVIRKYPLLSLSGLVSESLLDWMQAELHAEAFCEKIREEKKAGASNENLLLLILQADSYFTAAEIRDFRNYLMNLKRFSPVELHKETGKSYYEAGYPGAAAEQYGAAAVELDRMLRSEKDPDAVHRLQAEKADLFNDMASLRMLQFEKEEALRLLDTAEQICPLKRTHELRYLITGTADLSEAEKEVLDQKKKAAEEAAENSELCRKIRNFDSLDSIRALEESRKILKDWKQEYRKTS